jgi:uncharacterized protein YxjI
MGLRDRRQDRRDERQEDRQDFGRGGNAVRYQMRQKLVSIGDDFWIETDRGDRAFKVNGKALRVRSTLVFEDPQGGEVARIQDRPVRVREVMEVEGGDGSTLATIKKAMITPLRERFSITTAGGVELDAQGNLVDHEYEISNDGDKVAEVSKNWFRVRDSYGVQIEPGQDPILILTATVAIDMMSHD